MRKVLGLLMSLLLVSSLAACRWRPPAATVDGEAITEQDLKDDIDVLRNNPELASVLFSASGPIGTDEDASVPSDLTAGVLTGRILGQLAADGYARSGKQLSPEDEQARRTELNDQLASLVGSQEVLDAVPDEYLNRIVERAMHVTTLIEGLEGQEANDALTAVYSQGSVTIDPRYGTWDTSVFQVVVNPPPGVSGTTPPPTVDADAGA